MKNKRKLQTDKISKWVLAHVHDRTDRASFMIDVLEQIVFGGYSQTSLIKDVLDMSTEFKYCICRNFREDDHTSMKFACNSDDSVMRFNTKFLAECYAGKLARGEPVKIDLEPYGMKILTINEKDVWGLC